MLGSLCHFPRTLKILSKQTIAWRQKWGKQLPGKRTDREPILKSKGRVRTHVCTHTDGVRVKFTGGSANTGPRSRSAEAST